MSKLFSTGPIENAASNPALTVIVKVLNNSAEDTLTARTVLYNLNGAKAEIAGETISVAPLSCDYRSFEVDLLREYEIQIEIDPDNAALLSVWGLDAEARLIAAQRLVHTELKEYPAHFKKTRKISLPGRKNRKRRR